MFTKKHFTCIAEIVKNSTDSSKKIDREQLIEELSSFFKNQNPNFNQYKFIEACIPDEEDYFNG